jgi:hypothetical protein
MSSLPTIPATVVPRREHEPTLPPRIEDQDTESLVDLMNSHRRAQHRLSRMAAQRAGNADPDQGGEDVEEDEENFSPEHDDIHLSPRQLFANTEKRRLAKATYAHATSGLAAIRMITSQSSSVEQGDHQCTGYLISSVPIDVSDPGIFELAERKISQPSELFKHWCVKDKEFGDTCKKYTTEIATAISGQKLRSVLEGQLEYIINTKICSIELAVQGLIDISTRAARANQISSVLQEANERGFQIMLFNKAYMQVPTAYTYK